MDAINLAEGGSGVRTVPGTAGLFGTYAVSINICNWSDYHLISLLEVGYLSNGLCRRYASLCLIVDHFLL